MSSAGDNANFTITDTKLYLPIVTLSAEDNAKLSKLLDKWFNRPVYWNKYKVIPNKIVEIVANNEEKYTRELLDSSYQEVNLIQVTKELKDCFFLLIIMQKVIIKFLLILLENIFFQELK